MTTTTELSELTGDYVLDTTRSRIGFMVRQTFLQVRGQFDEFEGSAHLDGDDPSKSGAELRIQASTIRTGIQRRDKHLCSAFLDTAAHPAITFSSTKVERVEKSTFQVTGDLTVRGVTKPVTVEFELTSAEADPSGGVRVAFVGRAIINRKDWGVMWNAVAEGGGAFVGQKVTLVIDVAALRQP